jgi:sulfite oxidase
VTCALLRPAAGERLPAGPVEVAGVALAGGGRAVARVDVSADGGATWAAGELLEDQGPWAWRRFRATVELAPGVAELVARAWDDAGATQPERPETVWNPGGYANTAAPRVRVEVA